MTIQSAARPDLALVHAVLHCNVNTLHLAEAGAFWTALGLRERMRSHSDDTDARPLGLVDHTVSDTVFHWDERGPRAAPAVELVAWYEPITQARVVPSDHDGRVTGFHAVGIRAAEPADLVPEAGLREEVVVQGRRVPALLLTDPDGDPVEVVQVDLGTVDERAGGKFSHVRLVSTDLAATAAWYACLGFEVVPGPAGTLSLRVPEDPTFSLEFTEDRTAMRHPWQANTQGLYRIALAVEDVHDAHRSLVDQGLAVPDPVWIPMADTPTGGFTIVVLSDPDGAVVELVERPRAEVRRPLLPRGDG